MKRVCPVERSPIGVGLLLCLATLVEVVAALVGLYVITPHAAAGEPTMPASIVVSINDDGRAVVIAVEGREEPLHIVDVISLCGPPAVGEPTVRHAEQRDDGMISVVYGKHAFATVDPASGVVTCDGAD